MVMFGILQLLDSSHGRPLQNWKIASDKVVTVGRALDNDIVLADPFVSRAHAYLQFDAALGKWQVISISQHQLVHNGQTIAALDLTDGLTFRLGGQGCYLRFNQSAPEQVNNRQTMSVESLIRPKLALDEQQLDKSVHEIVDDDFFKNLKKSVERQRTRRANPDVP